MRYRKSYAQFVRDVTDKNCNNPLYIAAAMCGESGELANELKKVFRDDDGMITDERKHAILSEMGDVLWYLYALCDLLDVKMVEVKQINMTKIIKRIEEGRLCIH